MNRVIDNYKIEVPTMDPVASEIRKFILNTYGVYSVSDHEYIHNGVSEITFSAPSEQRREIFDKFGNVQWFTLYSNVKKNSI